MGDVNTSALEFLNPQQKEAVLHDQGPLLVLGGPATGKGWVIARRAVCHVTERGVASHRVLILAPTNLGVKEISRHLKDFVTSPHETPTVRTFHSFCAKVLYQEINRLGYGNKFIIYDASDSEAVLGECAAALKLDEERYSVRDLADAINVFKSAGLTPRDVPQATLSLVYTHYQDWLKRCNAVDFSDLLLLTVRIFEEHPEVLHKYRERYHWILVDDYQDTNPVQCRLVQLLAGERRNLCVVGDDDQSIYGWRGADIRNILEFEQDFPGATVVKLEQNYLSTKTILAGACNVVEKNRGRTPKRPWTDNPDGEPITYHTLTSEWEEARLVCRETERFLAEGGNLSEVAVLYRTNAQSRVIEDAMMLAGIHYLTVGGVRFYARLEVKDILAYLKVLDNPSDEVALKRIINTPPRGIGNSTVQRIAALASERGIPFYDAMLDATDGSFLPTAARKSVAAFIVELEKYRELAQSLPLHEMATAVIQDSGYLARLKALGSEEARKGIENLQKLVTEMQVFKEEGGGLSAFLKKVVFERDLDMRSEGPAVLIASVHSAKVLEFSLVFMVGMEERLFPHIRVLEDPVQMEEERRLCYVGMTRAKKRLYLLNVRRRHTFGQVQMNPPSRFIDDIPPRLLDSGDLFQQYGYGASPSQQYQATPYQKSAAVPGSITTNLPRATPTPAASGHSLASLFEEEPELDNEMRRMSEEHEEGVYLGMRVRHAQFGPGVVRKIEGEGENQKVIIAFASVGLKKLLVRFAGLEK